VALYTNTIYQPNHPVLSEKYGLLRDVVSEMRFVFCMDKEELRHFIVVSKKRVISLTRAL
jgi:hypothetical protein